MKSLTRGFVSLGIYLMGLGVCVAHEYTVGAIRIEDPWARALPAVSANGAAYMKIHNRGSNTDRLISASSPVAQRVELHMHVHEGGMMKMRRTDAVEVPAGGSAVFEPGALHVMLMGLRSPMSDGKEFPLTLRFERAGTVEVTVAVRKSSEAAMEHGGRADGGATHTEPGEHHQMDD